MVLRRLCAALCASLLAGGALVVAAAPSYAYGSCGSAPTLVGTTDDQVEYFDSSDWYVLPSSGPYAVVLQPKEGDVDLYVYDGCYNLICSSRASDANTDMCSGTAAGQIYVEVRLYTGGIVDYTVAGSGTATLPPSAGPCTTTSGQTACASLTATTPYQTFTVNAPGANPTNVAGYVDAYAFTLPNSGVVTMPCVRLVTGSTTTDPCGSAGGTYVSTLTSLSQTVAVPTTNLTATVVTVKVCNATVVLTVDGFGVNSFPAYAPC